MSKKKIKTKNVNVEIAPFNWQRLNAYIDNYNNDPDRSTAKLKFTDVVNEALFELFKAKKIVEK